MAKRKAGRARSSAVRGRKKAAARRSTRRPSVRKQAAKKPIMRKAKPAARATTRASAARKARDKAAKPPATVPRLDRARRTLTDDVVPPPPSSLNMDRHGSAARTGRAEYADNEREHHGMREVQAGDVDVDVDDAFFTGEEAPGGDNPTPDQDVVDDIGKALGVEYADNEELKGADKIGKRDKHRWELDPASSEDYKDRD